MIHSLSSRGLVYVEYVFSAPFHPSLCLKSCFVLNDTLMKFSGVDVVQHLSLLFLFCFVSSLKYSGAPQGKKCHSRRYPSCAKHFTDDLIGSSAWTLQLVTCYTLTRPGELCGVSFKKSQIWKVTVFHAENQSSPLLSKSVPSFQVIWWWAFAPQQKGRGSRSRLGRWPVWVEVACYPGF